jgi:hypothetical protein
MLRHHPEARANVLLLQWIPGKLDFWSFPLIKWLEGQGSFDPLPVQGSA